MRVRKLAVIVALLLASVAGSGADVRPARAQAEGDAAADTAATRGRAAREAKVAVTRSAWMFGGGAGYGITDPRFDFYKPGSEPGPTLNVRLGYAASPRTVVGIEWAQFDVRPDTISWRFRALMPTVTWYSKGRADNASQAFLRLGAGWGQMIGGAARVERSPALVVPPRPDTTITATIRDDGFALLGAVGYEWRYGRRYGIAPQAQVAFVNVAKGYNGIWGEVSLQVNRYW